MDKMKMAKKIFIMAMITAFAGQIYLTPFASHFRFSFSVVILTVLILRFEDIPILTGCFFTGLTIYIFRTGVLVLETGYISPQLLTIHLPAMMYYIFFSVFITLFGIRSSKKRIAFLISQLWISDVSSNILELALRGKASIASIDSALTLIILIGLFRSIVSFILYNWMDLYNAIVLKEERELRYREMLVQRAGLKTDLFFLKKTSKDIEKAMALCYSLYEESKDKTSGPQSCSYLSIARNKILSLTKDIHEIKKDNIRIISSISKLIPFEEETENIKVSYIFDTIYWSTKRMLENQNKAIFLNFNLLEDLEVKDCYSIISILNNLIINAVEAMGNEGNINVTSYSKDDYYVIEVQDSGAGIDKTHLNSNVIFQPGFSTKYDPRTGSMSTGMGLTHIKNIVDDIYKGYIIVESEQGNGTIFSIYLFKELL